MVAELVSANRGNSAYSHRSVFWTEIQLVMETPRNTTSARRGPTGFYWHPQRPQNHLAVKDDCTKGRRAQDK